VTSRGRIPKSRASRRWNNLLPSLHVEGSPANAQGTGAKDGRALAHLVQHRGRHQAHGDATGLHHDDGWFDILWRLCEDLEPLVAEFEQETGSQFEVLQVKEKFGGLRFYVNCRRNDAIRQRILAAIEESFHTCEICGQPGKLREDSWIKTLCDLHDGAQGEQE
jgi:hypothetical protein